MQSWITHFNRQFYALYNHELSQLQKDQFVLYLSYISKFNKLYNLTGFHNPQEIVNNLFIDSLTGIKQYGIPGKAYTLDVGCGAGIPSIPVKIAFPQLSLVLIDSSHKKIDFINTIIAKLGLTNISTVCERAEDAAHTDTLRGQFDMVFAKAVSPLPILLELAIPFLKISGNLLAYKGSKSPEEIQQSANALQKLGCKIDKILWYSIEDPRKKHALIVVKKLRKTDAVYPRKPGILKKKPL